MCIEITESNSPSLFNIPIKKIGTFGASFTVKITQGVFTFYQLKNNLKVTRNLHEDAKQGAQIFSRLFFAAEVPK